MVSEKYICDACKVREPWEHRCFDRNKCQCEHCRIIDLEIKIEELKNIIKSIDKLVSVPPEDNPFPYSTLLAIGHETKRIGDK